MVTIVIPCYNATQYIDKCMMSLEAQTFQQFKVILVDDHSTDDTYQHLLKLQTDSALDITVLQNPKNSGPAISRNSGVKAATTKYITFCDSDDWYEKDFLQKMFGLLHKYDADIAFCGYKVVDEKKNTILRPISESTGLMSREEVFRLDADSLCMMMVKTAIMKDTILPNLRNGEDVATVPLLIAKSNKYVVTSDCLYNYYRRSDSASERPTMKVVDSLLSSFEHVKENFPEEQHTELEFLGIKNVLYSAIIVLFSIGYNVKRSKEILINFEKDFPDWRMNPYRKEMRIYKRTIISMLSIKCFWGIRMIAILRNIIIK